NGRGGALPNMQKATLAQALERDDLSEEARYVIDLRAGGAQAAANKIRTMRDWRNEDGRARGTLRYHGASTGRWSAGGIQTQNMKKPTVDVAEAIEHVVTGDYDRVKRHYARPLSVLGDLTRALITAAPG